MEGWEKKSTKRIPFKELRCKDIFITNVLLNVHKFAYFRFRVLWFPRTSASYIIGFYHPSYNTFVNDSLQDCARKLWCCKKWLKSVSCAWHEDTWAIIISCTKNEQCRFILKIKAQMKCIINRVKHSRVVNIKVMFLSWLNESYQRKYF